VEAEEPMVEAEAPTVEGGVLLDRALARASKRRLEYWRQPGRRSLGRGGGRGGARGRRPAAGTQAKTSGGGGGCPRQRRLVVAAGALGARWRPAAADLGTRERERERASVMCGWAGPSVGARLWGLSLLISVG
jgi:hypothetical protein